MSGSSSDATGRICVETNVADDVVATVAHLPSTIPAKIDTLHTCPISIQSSTTLAGIGDNGSFDNENTAPAIDALLPGALSEFVFSVPYQCSAGAVTEEVKTLRAASSCTETMNMV